MIGHPSWCSPEHCFLDEDGVWVHVQEPVRWEECEVRFESRLLFPDGEHPPATYLQLSINNLRLTWRFVDVFLPIAAARRLRDQLTAHLDSVDNCRPRRPSFRGQLHAIANAIVDAMATTTMQLDTELRDQLAHIAQRDFDGATLGEALQRLVTEHRINRIMHRYEQLRADPDEWASYRAETQLTDNATGDGLPSASDEYREHNG